jgi:hypothetical protein
VPSLAKGAIPGDKLSVSEKVPGCFGQSAKRRQEPFQPRFSSIVASSAEPRAGWERTLRRERADLAEDLTPALRPRIERGLDRFYETARIEAAAALRPHGDPAAADALPPTLPYTLDQITGDWLPSQGAKATKG